MGLSMTISGLTISSSGVKQAYLQPAMWAERGPTSSTPWLLIRTMEPPAQPRIRTSRELT